MELASSPPNCDDREYTSCYCEENIYWLVKRFLSSPESEQQWDVSAVFISNPTRTVTDMKNSSYVRMVLKFIIHTGGIMEPADGIIQRHSNNMGLPRRFSASRAPAGAQPVVGLLSNQ